MITEQQILTIQEIQERINDLIELDRLKTELIKNLEEENLILKNRIHELQTITSIREK